MRRCQVSIDLGALRHNLQRVRQAAPGCRVMAAIKANGYGHGLVRVANALEESDSFGVACIDEALELRAAGVTAPIILLEGFFHPDEIPLVEQHRLELLLHHPAQIAALEQATIHKPIRVWLKVDTGMHRLGVPPEETSSLWQRLERHPGLHPLGQMTHLACADEPDHPATAVQLELFRRATASLPGERAIANSAGILGWPETHAEWVRPGIMLYGVSPFVGGRAAEHGLKPVMTLSSELIAVNRLSEGDTVGYGATWRCPEAMTIGVVAVGYGDGYPRHAVTGTPVLVNGRRVPLIGRVSMDMLCVDLRSQSDAQIGDPVVLWGDGLPVEEVAEASGTIAYELLCSVTERVALVERG
ncbi:MAG TPA: alanine racemase [Gammaproteobacteria bacterium]|jgi:alanine racemase